MPAPFHIIPGPVTAYVAPLATAFPVLGVAPAAAWILLGVNGANDMTEDGLTIRHGYTTEDFRGVGNTAVRKTFPTEESLEVEFTLADMTMENYAKALGNVATAAGGVTTVVGPPATKSVNLLHGFTVVTHALLLRLAQSAYGEGTATFTTQWKIPMVMAAGTPELVFVKGAPIGMHFLYKCLWDPTLGYGSVEMGTA